MSQNSIKELAGTTDAVNQTQLNALAAGRFLGWFQIVVYENQSYLAIPTAYQSKGAYVCYSESLLIPPHNLSVSAASIVVNTSTGFYLSAGVVTVHVYS